MEYHRTMSKKNIGVSGSKEFTAFYKSLEPNDPIKKNIDDAMDLLKQNPTIGDRIPEKLWPNKYIKKYGINNLFRYSLRSNWRMIYTIMGYSNEIVCSILEVLDHKNYDILFGYKTS